NDDFKATDLASRSAAVAAVTFFASVTPPRMPPKKRTHQRNCNRRSISSKMPSRQALSSSRAWSQDGPRFAVVRPGKQRGRANRLARILQSVVSTLHNHFLAPAAEEACPGDQRQAGGQKDQGRGLRNPGR